MAVLSFSGGVVFILPFLQEVYYEALTEAFSINNTEVGALMSVFGIASMISYLPGGWLADRVSPRWLISLSLLGTGIGGLYFATFPSYRISLAIHAFWGVTIALLFWGAMIRATREWGGKDEQGRAFGILESGRGIGEIVGNAALFAVFGWLGSQVAGFSTVVNIMSVVLIGLGVLAFFTLEDNSNRDSDSPVPTVGLQEIKQVLQMPIVWLITVVILTGYCGYWGIIRVTPYATDVFMMSAALAGTVAIAKMWLKPVAAFVAGWLADRLGISIAVAGTFAILIFCFLVFAFIPGTQMFVPYMLVNLSLASIAVFAMRGIYFALLEEGGVPLAVTGTATGIISVLGYTPDIFMPVMGGMFLDNFPGIEGHRYFFLTTAALCVIGLIASLTIYNKYVKKPTNGSD